MKPSEKLRLLIPMDKIEQSAQTQIWEAAQLPFVKTLAVMPDVHMGYSLPIGGVALLDGVISPGYVGYDIGCGMCHRVVPDVRASEFDQATLKQLYAQLASVVPHGLGIAHEAPVYSFKWQSSCGDKKFSQQIDATMSRQVGSLGAGNHFIEIGTNKDEQVAITIHSGSRGAGYKVAAYYLAKAQSEDKRYPNGFLGIEHEWGAYYEEDMNGLLSFALLNRLSMLDIAEKVLLKVLGRAIAPVKYDVEAAMAAIDGDRMRGQSATINENHNHAVRYKGGILHRKGATPALLGQPGVIPGTMASGVAITRGLGNHEFLSSASHGSGRVMSRSAAKKSLTVGTMRELMSTVVSNVSERSAEDVLDEHPSAYKDMNEVLAYQDGVVIDIMDRFTPILNLKG